MTISSLISRYTARLAGIEKFQATWQPNRQRRQAADDVVGGLSDDQCRALSLDGAYISTQQLREILAIQLLAAVRRRGYVQP